MNRILITLLFLTQPALAADQALTQCRQIVNVEERVACYDAIIDSRSEKPAPDAIPDAQSLFGTNDADAKRIVETSLDIEQIDEIEAVVTDVRKSATRKLTVTLDNGQTWRQLDNQPMRLQTGETVIVRKASLGSFLMEKQSGGRSIRVKRAN